MKDFYDNCRFNDLTNLDYLLDLTRFETKKTTVFVLVVVFFIII